MNKIERTLLLPLTVAAAAAGVVEGIIIYNRMAKVKVADAALKELAEKAGTIEEVEAAEEAESAEEAEAAEGAENDTENTR